MCNGKLYCSTACQTADLLVHYSFGHPIKRVLTQKQRLTQRPVQVQKEDSQPAVALCRVPRASIEEEEEEHEEEEEEAEEEEEEEEEESDLRHLSWY
jgi:hypothetical protein